LARLLCASCTQKAFRFWVLGALLTLVPGAIGSTNGYKIVFLGELRQAGSTTPRAVNSCGQVVGESGGIDNSDVTAFTWEEGRPIRGLEGLPGGEFSQAVGLNDEGVIVGSSNTSTALRAVMWTRDGKFHEIGALPGDKGSQALAINNRGEVAGSSSGPRGTRAFLWTEKNGIRDLGGLPGSDYTEATALNDSDQVVGFSGKTGVTHAFLWSSDEGIKDLGVLPGDSTSQAFGVNNQGQVVGWSRGPHGTHAFIWTKPEGMRNLGGLPNGTSTEATAINDRAEVVGLAGDGKGYRGFRWTSEDGVQDLNALLPPDAGVLLVGAFGINNRGQIVAYGGPSNAHTHHFNAPRAYLLTPSVGASPAKSAACTQSPAGVLTTSEDKPEMAGAVGDHASITRDTSFRSGSSIQ
jgi:probable HAF family extracellular repeat protein